MESYTIVPIAKIRSDYREKFGIPKQSGLVNELEQAVVFEPGFAIADALREISGFSRIWIIWGFSDTAYDMTSAELKWSPTVRPPRIGGDRRVGVWASRSPFRPNSLGLSNVRLLRVEIDGKPVDIDERSGVVPGELALIVSGADMKDGTPVYDIKPYLPYADSHPDAECGYSTGASDPHLKVEFPEHLLERIESGRPGSRSDSNDGSDLRAGLIRTLSLDPRGAYEKKDGYSYGMVFGQWDIRFTVTGSTLTVTDVVPAESGKEAKL